MFDTVKFGRALAELRKGADMTQNAVADRLNLSRQAVSRYECGESFPDISILVQIASLFDLTLDALIGLGDPSVGEARILCAAANGETAVGTGSAADVVNLAPLLKPSTLSVLAEQLGMQGIDLSDLVRLAEYLNDETAARLIMQVSFDGIGDDLLTALLPFLNTASKEAIFRKILNGEMDWRSIEAFLPYADAFLSQIEAAIVEGALPWEASEIVNRYCMERP